MQKTYGAMQIYPANHSARSIVLRTAPYVIAALIGIAVYVRAVNGSFIWDDEVFIEHLKANPDLTIADVFTSPFIGTFGDTGGNFYRPIVSLSFLLDFRLWRLNPLGYHLHNLVLHALCILAVAWLAFLVLGSRTAAVGAAFLFAVHPAHSQSVAWISGRTDLFCALFLVPALCTYILYYRTRRISLLGISLVLTALALMSKELALLMPLLAGLITWGMGERNYRRILLNMVPYLVLACIFFMVRSAILTGSQPFQVQVPWKLRLAIMAYSLYTHFQILLLPQTAKLGYLLKPDEIISPTTAFYGSALALVTLSLWANRGLSRIPFFCMAWFLLTILPVSGMPGSYSTGMVSERFVYLPSLSLAFAFGWLLAKATQGGSAKLGWLAMALGLVLISAFAVLSVIRSGLYTSDVTFWEQFIRDSPRNPAGYYNLGIAYAHANKLEEAVTNFEKSINLAPGFKQAYYWLGRTYIDLRKYDQAINVIEKGLEIAPDDPILEDLLKQAFAAKVKSLNLAKPTHVAK